MENKTRIVRGPEGTIMAIPKPTTAFTKAEKEHVILEYLNGEANKNQIWKKYVGKTDKGRLLSWMKQLGYTDDKDKAKKANLDQNQLTMVQENIKNNQKLTKEELTKEELQAKLEALEQREVLSKRQIEALEQREALSKKQIEALERGMELATIKVEAYSTMIDLAEEAFKIPIRKKFNTKPSKK